MTVLLSQRHLFDIPDDIAYFNCAYNSPLLNRSRDSLHTGVDSKSHPWQRTVPSFFEDAECIRGLASQIFGGDVDGYAVVPAASYGFATAARAVEPCLKKGDRILVVEEEFPSGVLCWMSVARETGASLVTVPTPSSGTWTRAILDHLDNKVKVVSLSTCHWTNGALIDLLPIAKACQDIGAVLAIDATQSISAMPFSVDEIKPDFLIAAGYKWLLCPYGFGLMYVSERWRSARPLEETWLARDNAENFAALAQYSERYMPGARRFDVGEKCTPTILPGAVCALEQIRAWGVANIAETLSSINRPIIEHLQRLGFGLPEESSRCPHMFGATTPKGYTGNLVSQLKEKRIFISQRANSIRIAPHLHITPNDVDRLLQTIDELIR